MGKPFSKELMLISDTIKWASAIDVTDIRENIHFSSDKPLYIVGSGGSLSACHLAAHLYQNLGTMAKAITPLELQYSQNALRNSNLLFISASGRNSDIVFAYKTALQCDPYRIFSICMNKNSHIAKLSLNHSICYHYDFENPAGKDGFLATNSLVAFFSILSNVLSLKENNFYPISIDSTYILKLNLFLDKVFHNSTFIVLYGGLGQSVAVDIESKLVEAALGNVLISDYRNFGHGRHHWIDKRTESSAIISLITPNEKYIADKTLSLLPNDIPTLIIESEIDSPFSTLEILQKSFLFIEKIGKLKNIDPGRPGVPDYGSKLYHLNYQRFYTKKVSKKDIIERTAIIRKADIPFYDILSPNEELYWKHALSKFLIKLGSTEYGTVIFDYDGTICSARHKSMGIEEEIVKHINKILDHGMLVGIATGRGKSVREDLSNKILRKNWDRVIIGYYNCSDIGFLSDLKKPNSKPQKNSILNDIFQELKSQDFISNISPELKPHQIVIEGCKKADWRKIKPSVIQYLRGLNIKSIQVLESNHSIDIVDLEYANKLNIVRYCENLAITKNLPQNCICIGDKGKWPGNDYQLLSSEYSLSVDEVTSLPHSCWNLSYPSMRNTEATIYYLSCLVYNKNSLTFQLK